MAQGRWSEGAYDKVKQQLKDGTLDFTTRYTNIQQDIIMAASKANKAIKIFNLGAGVKRIKSVDINGYCACPVCGRFPNG
jgi:hypothetical protein